MRIIGTLIGHKQLFIIVTASFLLHGCFLFEWDHCGPYSYDIEFSNETNDTIDLLLVPHDHSHFISILPDSIVYYSGFCLEEDESVLVDGLFNTNDNRFWNEISIRWQDSLIHTWVGPDQVMADSIHHFFNHNSWVYVSKEEVSPEYRYIRFVILETDLTIN